MGVYEGPIRIRGSAWQTTNAEAVQYFDQMHAAVVGCGMVQLTAEEDSGQAGTFVSGTPGAGEVQVVVPTSNARTTVGYRTYRLPDSLVETSPVLVRIYYLTEFHTSSQSGSGVRFGYSLKLGEGPWSGVEHPGFELPSSDAWHTSCALQKDNVVLAACGEGYFWVSILDSIGHLVSAAATSTFARARLSAFTFAVLRPAGVSGAMSSSNLLAVRGPRLNSSSSGAWLFETIEFSAAVKYQEFSSGTWKNLRPGSLGGLMNPRSPLKNGGLRVAHAAWTFGQDLLHVPMGFAAAAPVNYDGMPVEVALTGVTPKTFRALRGLQPAAALSGFDCVDINDVSLCLLPWEP